MRIIIVLISAVLLIAAAILIDTHYKRKNRRTETTKLPKAYSYLHKITYECLSLEGLYCVFREIIRDLDISFILSPYGIFRAKTLDDCRMSDIYLGNIYIPIEDPIQGFLMTNKQIRPKDEFRNPSKLEEVSEMIQAGRQNSG